MAEALSVELVEHWHRFIAAKVASGAYESAQELVTSALCMLEENEERVDRLTGILESAEVDGGFEPWDYPKFLAEVRQRGQDREAA